MGGSVSGTETQTRAQEYDTREPGSSVLSQTPCKCHQRLASVVTTFSVGMAPMDTSLSRNTKPDYDYEYVICHKCCTPWTTGSSLHVKVAKMDHKNGRSHQNQQINTQSGLYRPL